MAPNNFVANCWHSGHSGYSVELFGCIEKTIVIVYCHTPCGYEVGILHETMNSSGQDNGLQGGHAAAISRAGKSTTGKFSCRQSFPHPAVATSSLSLPAFSPGAGPLSER